MTGSGRFSSTRARCQACQGRLRHFCAVVADSGVSTAPHPPSRVVSSLQIVFLTGTLTYLTCNHNHISVAVAFSVLNSANRCTTPQPRYSSCALIFSGRPYHRFATLPSNTSLLPVNSVTRSIRELLHDFDTPSVLPSRKCCLGESNQFRLLDLRYLVQLKSILVVSLLTCNSRLNINSTCRTLYDRLISDCHRLLFNISRVSPKVPPIPDSASIS